MSVSKPGSSSFDPESGKSIKRHIKKMGKFLGKKVGLIKSTKELRTEYRKTDGVLSELEQKFSSDEFKYLNRASRGTPKDVEAAKGTLRRIKVKASQGGEEDQKIYQTAKDVIDISILQGQIAKELKERGSSLSSTSYRTERSESESVDSTESVSLSLPDLDQVEVEERVETLITALFEGYELKTFVKSNEPVPEGVETETLTDEHGVTREFYTKSVDKREIQNDFIAGVSLLKETDPKALPQIAKALRDAFDTRGAEVLPFLEALGKVSPDVAASALNNLAEQNAEQNKDLEIANKITRIINNLPTEEISEKSEPARSSQLIDNTGGITPSALSRQVLKSKKKTYQREVQRFADLVISNNTTLFMEADLSGKDLDQSRSQFVEDSNDMNQFVLETVMSQSNRKKVSKMCGFLLDVARELENREIAGRKGDYHGMQMVVSPLSNIEISRLLDESGRNALTKKQLETLERHEEDGVLNLSASLQAKMGNRAMDEGVLPLMPKELKDAFGMKDNYNKKNPQAAVEFLSVMGKKMQKYDTLRQDLAEAELPEPEYRLSLEEAEGNDKEFYYERSLELKPRGT